MIPRQSYNLPQVKITKRLIKDLLESESDGEREFERSFTRPSGIPNDMDVVCINTDFRYASVSIEKKR